MSITAADIMTAPAIVVRPETNMAEIASLLASKRFSAVPVCHPDNTLAGIVSESDILRPFRELVRARRDWWLGVIAEGEELPQDFLDYLRRDTRTAADVMVPPCHYRRRTHDAAAARGADAQPWYQASAGAARRQSRRHR